MSEYNPDTSGTHPGEHIPTTHPGQTMAEAIAAFPTAVREGANGELIPINPEEYDRVMGIGQIAVPMPESIRKALPADKSPKGMSSAEVGRRNATAFLNNRLGRGSGR